MWSTPGNRLRYLDNLKIALMMLVVAHHAAQPYGPGDWWYVQGGERAGVLASFTTVNGAFFMSLFFVVSAFLVPAAYDRKGGWVFLKDRMRRLALPLLFGFFVIMPALMYAYYVTYRGYGPISFVDYYLDVYHGGGEHPADWIGPSWPDRQFGHFWFIQHLLVYAFLYAGWRLATRWRRPAAPPAEPSPPRAVVVVLFMAVVAAGTFLVRIWYPLDTWVPLLEFIQTEPADLVQYASFFIVGLIAYRRGWLHALSARAGYAWLGVGGALAALHLLAGWLDGVYDSGGYTAGSLIWSAMETTMCTALCLGLVVAFRQWGNRSGRWLDRMVAATFTVYIIHVPVVVALQFALAPTGLGPLASFAVVAAFGIVASFALAHVLRQIPYVRRVV